MFKSMMLAGVLALVSVSNASAVEKKCVFGDDVAALEESTRFTVQPSVIQTFKLNRLEGGEGQLVMVNVAIAKDKKTARVFHVNTTFRHKDDGDNTWGWIEEVTGSARADSGVKNEGAVVASISDSWIECADASLME